jgi:glycosyltransferase involved in cell wall biosynthesis
MRIVHIAGELSVLMGGPTTSTTGDCLASRLKGHEIVVVTPAYQGSTSQSESALREAGCVVATASGGPTGRLRLWVLSPAMLALVWHETRRAEVIHVHGPWWLPGLFALVAARMRGIPAVLTPHGSLRVGDRHSGNGITRRMKATLRPLVDRLCDAIVYSSPMELALSRTRASARKSLVVWPGLQVPPESVASTDAGAATFVVGFLGRLHPVKNVESLIRAVPLLSADCQLRLAGDGVEAYVGTLRKLAQDEATGRDIQFVGKVDGAAKMSFLRQLDVLVLSSWSESFGIAAAEAMLVGTPVIVSDRSGIADLVRSHDGGLVVSPTPQALAAAIDRFRLEPEWRARVAHNALSVADTLSMQTHAAALDAVYEQAAARHAGRGRSRNG